MTNAIECILFGVVGLPCSG